MIGSIVPLTVPQHHAPAAQGPKLQAEGGGQRLHFVYGNERSFTLSSNPPTATQVPISESHTTQGLLSTSLW